MSNRLDQEREKEFQPKRMEYAIEQLSKIVTIDFKDETRLEFFWRGERIKFFPYSGWATGQSIKDGRGLKNLLNQLK